MKNDKWLNLVGSEVMDSDGAERIISVAVGLIKEKIKEPESVLCVGCGGGTEMEMWNNPQGIDLNKTSLERCRQKGLMVHEMDMHKMSFNDDAFELVFARDVFEHAISPIRAISEMSRVSSKYVAIVVPDESWQSSEWHFLIPTMKQMISLGEKVGLSLLMYREYSFIVGNSDVWQNLYLFKK